MTALHDGDTLTCPRCGQQLDGDLGPAQTTATNRKDVEAMQIRAEVECPNCTAPLEIVFESALPDAIGVEIWVEDRTEDTADGH